MQHGLFIGDAHSKNICLASIAGEIKFVIVDGKVAGFTDNTDEEWRRLQVKRRFELNRYHRCFLDSCLEYIDGVWRTQAMPDDLCIAKGE